MLLLPVFLLTIYSGILFFNLFYCFCTIFFPCSHFSNYLYFISAFMMIFQVILNILYSSFHSLIAKSLNGLNKTFILKKTSNSLFLFLKIPGGLSQDPDVARPRVVQRSLWSPLQAAETNLWEPSHCQSPGIFSGWEQGRRGNFVHSFSGKINQQTGLRHVHNLAHQ